LNDALVHDVLGLGAAQGPDCPLGGRPIFLQ